MQHKDNLLYYDRQLISDLQNVVWDYLIDNNFLMNSITSLDPSMVKRYTALLTTDQWLEIAGSLTLTEEFMTQFADRLDWKILSSCQVLSESFIRQHIRSICWFNISCYQYLSEQFIIDFQYQVNWDQISASQALSEEFIINHINKINWTHMPNSRQIFSHDFIVRFADKLNWRLISANHPMSDEFITEFGNYLYWDILITQLKENLSKKCIKKYIHKFNDNPHLWVMLLEYKTLSPAFMIEFKNQITLAKRRRFIYNGKARTARTASFRSCLD